MDIQVKPFKRKMERELWLLRESNGASDIDLKFIPREMIVEAKALAQFLKEIMLPSNIHQSLMNTVI